MLIRQKFYNPLFLQVPLLEEYFDLLITQPAAWTTIDRDGDKQNWRFETADTEIFAVSESWLSGRIGLLRTENYPVSPKIGFTGRTGMVAPRYTINIINP